ncbi:MAG: hypothetical protein KAW41_04450 [Candidatus Diapherotrites archaeon]|nr:hypothetical protein [Candidatus Diapherotrites archaeon]
MKKKRGFAVFTPMVGTLVILITMLIVTSIITSERIAVQGSVKAYRSSELVNIAGEAQSRVIEEVRSSITSRLEDYSIRGEPVMSIVVNDCPSGELAADLNFPDPECGEGDCVCGVTASGVEYCTSGEQTCWANTFHQVNLTAANELTAKALLESSIQHTIQGIVSKYSLVNVTAKPVEFGGIVKDIKFKDCMWDDCKDGRIEVTIDFTPLAEEPIAEIASEGKRLEVFMPAEERVYTTHEPFMKYAVLTSDLFNNFQLLNESWHNAGGGDSHDPDYEGTNGSEWYHYNYAIHERYYGSVGQNTAGSGWAPGFEVDNAVAEDYFEAGGTLSDYMAWAIGKKARPVVQPFPTTQNLRFDKYFTGKPDWKPLTEFVSGYASFTTGAGLPKLKLNGMPLGDSEGQKLTVYPGGSIAHTGGQNDADGVDTCLGNDDTFALKEHHTAGTTLVDTTEAYDKRFMTGEDWGMAAKVKEMRDSIKSEVAVGLGVAKEHLNYELVIDSKQYYLEGNGFQGRDNWHCGEFVTLYQVRPPLSADDIAAVNAENACEAARNIYTKESPGDTRCTPGDCTTVCGDEESDCPWFISEPIEWTCDSKTLYRVEEIYRLYRSTPGKQEPERPVFAAKYTRVKDDYGEIGGGGHNYTLWKEYPRYDDTVSGDAIKRSWERDVNNVRKCTYSYNTVDDAVTRECGWVTAEEA